MRNRKARSRIRTAWKRQALAETLEPRWLFSANPTDPSNGGTAPDPNEMPSVNLTTGLTSIDVAAPGSVVIFGQNAGLDSTAASAEGIQTFSFADTGRTFIQVPNWTLGTVQVDGDGALSELHGIVRWNDGQTTPLNAAIGALNPDGTVDLNLYTSRGVSAGETLTANVNLTDTHTSVSGAVTISTAKMDAMFLMPTSSGTAAISISPSPANRFVVSPPPPGPTMVMAGAWDWGFEHKLVLVLQEEQGDGDSRGDGTDAMKAERRPQTEVVQESSAQQPYTLGVGNLIVAKGDKEAADSDVPQTASAAPAAPEKKEASAPEAAPADPGTFEGEFSLLAAAERPAREKQSDEDLDDPYQAKEPGPHSRAVAVWPARVVEEQVQIASHTSAMRWDDQRLLDARRNSEPHAGDRETATAAMLESTFISRALAGLAVITAFQLLQPGTRERLKRGLLVWRGVRVEGWDDVD